jgi:hypothetical protein
VSGLTTNRHAELVSASIRRRARSHRWQTQPHRKIDPLRILALDQIDLPLPVPPLQLFLAVNGGFHRVSHLEADETVNAMARRKARNRPGAMLMQPRDQVRCDADVKRPIRLARENIDTRLLLHSCSTFPPNRRPELVSGPIAPQAPTVRKEKWMLKQVQHDGELGTFTQ